MRWPFLTLQSLGFSREEPRTAKQFASAKRERAVMSLYTWLNMLHAKTQRSRRKPWRRGSRVRPALEPLEDRLVLDTRIWSGGDPLSSNWIAVLNWQNGAIFPPLNPVQDGDSVDFPADA